MDKGTSLQTSQSKPSVALGLAQSFCDSKYSGVSADCNFIVGFLTGDVIHYNARYARIRQSSMITATALYLLYTLATFNIG